MVGRVVGHLGMERSAAAARTSVGAAVAMALVLGLVSTAGGTGGGDEGAEFPRLANIYFAALPDADLEKLSGWDVLVLGRRGQDWYQDELAELRVLNPDITLLAHFAIGYHGDATAPAIEADIRTELYEHDWWMKDTAGQRVYLPNGDGLVNLTIHCPRDQEGRRLCDWFPEYIAERIPPGGLWDGVFLDYCMDWIDWLNQYLPLRMDADGDGIGDDADSLDANWREGTEALVSGLRELVGDDYLLVTNGNNSHYGSCNGSTRENFPYMHGDWYQNITNPQWGYMAIDRYYRSPSVNIINSIWEGPVTLEGPVRTPAFERKLRFAFTSTLCFGDGYFSLDGGEGLLPHSQAWWYEYYDLELGRALGDATQPPAEPGDGPGVYLGDMIRLRRFAHGVAVVNPSSSWQVIDLGGLYHHPCTWNGEFYPRSAAATRVAVEPRSGAVLVGCGHLLDWDPLFTEAWYDEAGRVVRLAWEPCGGAQAYSVYRATEGGDGALGPSVLIGVASAPLYEDTDATRDGICRYEIAPIDAEGGEGQPCRPVFVSTEGGSGFAPALAVGESDGLPVLTWTTPGAASDLELDVVRTDGDGNRVTLTSRPLAASSPARLVDHTAEPGRAYLYEMLSHASGLVLAAVRGPAPDSEPVRQGGTALRGCWPQPMGDVASIAFHIANDACAEGSVPASLVVHDASGRVVRRLLDARLPAGDHAVFWDGRTDAGSPVASGCYFYVLEVGGAALPGKALVVR